MARVAIVSISWPTVSPLEVVTDCCTSLTFSCTSRSGRLTPSTARSTATEVMNDAAAPRTAAQLTALNQAGPAVPEAEACRLTGPRANVAARSSPGRTLP